MKGEVTVTGVNHNSKKNRPLAFKSNALFTNCISKINNVLIDNTEDLDVAMPMCNLIEYSENYRKTTGSLYNYYRDELINDINNNNNLNKIVINSESFNGSTYNANERITNAESNQVNNPNYDDAQSGKKVEIVVPLKYLSNFCRSLVMPLINYEVSLTLTWFEHCVITSLERREKKYTKGLFSKKCNI